jgi:hypothetical protein
VGKGSLTTPILELISESVGGEGAAIGGTRSVKFPVEQALMLAFNFVCSGIINVDGFAMLVLCLSEAHASTTDAVS